MLGSSLPLMKKRVILPRLFAGTLVELGPGNYWSGPVWLRQNEALEWIGVGFPELVRTRIWEYAKTHRLTRRICFVEGSFLPMALPDASADWIISFGGMRSWQTPLAVFNELARILKPGGDLFMGDVRQEASSWQRWWAGHRSPEFKQMYQSSAAGISKEYLQALLLQTPLAGIAVENHGPDLWAYHRG